MPAPTHPTQSQPPQPTQQPPAWQPPPPEWGQATNPTPPPRPKRRRRTVLVAVGVGLALLIVGGVAGGGDPSPASGPASNAAAPAPEAPEPEGTPIPPKVEGPTQLAEGDSGVTHDVLGKPTARITVRNVREVRDPYDMVNGRWVVADVKVTALADNIFHPRHLCAGWQGPEVHPVVHGA